MAEVSVLNEVVMAALRELGIEVDLDTLLAHKVYPEVKVVVIVADGRKMSVPWASLPQHAEQPLLIRDVPANTLAALVEAGYTTLDAIAAASDEDLLAVDSVGKAMLKRIWVAVDAPRSSATESGRG